MTNGQEIFATTRGFRGWPIQWNHVQCCGPTLVAMETKFGQIWAIFFDKIAYKPVCMPDRPDLFGPTRGDDQGPIIVAMATTFALGAESNRLPACLYLCLCAYNTAYWPFR